MGVVVGKRAQPVKFFLAGCVPEGELDVHVVNEDICGEGCERGAVKVGGMEMYHGRSFLRGISIHGLVRGGEGLTKDRGFAVERARRSIAIFLAIAVGLTYYTVGK